MRLRDVREERRPISEEMIRLVEYCRVNDCKRFKQKMDEGTPYKAVRVRSTTKPRLLTTA
jgi:hypothetical protein